MFIKLAISIAALLQAVNANQPTTSSIATTSIVVKASSKLAPVVICSGAASCKPGYGYASIGSCTQCTVGSYSRGNVSVCINCPGALTNGASVCPAVQRIITSIKSSSIVTNNITTITSIPSYITTTTTTSKPTCAIGNNSGACQYYTIYNVPSRLPSGEITTVGIYMGCKAGVCDPAPTMTMTATPYTLTTVTTSSTSDPYFHVDCPMGYSWPDSTHRDRCVPNSTSTPPTSSSTTTPPTPSSTTTPKTPTSSTTTTPPTTTATSTKAPTTTY